MRLIPSAKSAAAEADNRILVGSIVEYEQHGAPFLAVVSSEKRGKWGVVNGKGAQLDLAPDRLYLLPGRIPAEVADNQGRISFLEKLDKEVEQVCSKINLEELWALVSGERAELSSRELTELALGENTLRNHAAMRRALLADTVYFKRGKSNFLVRPEELVTELKTKRNLELKQAEERLRLRDALVQRILEPAKSHPPLPENINILEEYAAFGKSAPQSKEALSLVEEIEQKARITPEGHAPERAFQLLLAAKHFGPEEDLNFLKLGRPRRFRPELIAEVEKLLRDVPVSLKGRLDLRALKTFTIDSATTKDRDDALSVEFLSTGLRFGIHISDVTPWMNQSVLLEHQARTRATTIYTPDYTVPMLPEIVSENAFSLLPGVDRAAISFLVTTNEEGRIVSREIRRSVINVRMHVSYPEADAVLFGEKPGATYEDALSKFWEFTLQQEHARQDRGAMQFSQKEMFARIQPDGTITIEELIEDTAAHKIVGEMMILVNETAALFARDRNLPMIFRSQEPPDCNLDEQGLDVPEGPARDFAKRSLLKRSAVTSRPAPHSGLGLLAYLQITSPIRRYVDMVNERQLVHALERDEPHYSAEEIDQIIEAVRAGLDEAIVIQRDRNRYWLLRYLEQQGKKELTGLIMKTDGPKPLAELDEIFLWAPFHPAGAKDPDSMRARRGERVRLTIEQLNPRKDALHLREAVAE